MPNILTDIINEGKLPEVPFSVSLESDTIIKLAIAEVLVGIIIILLTVLITKK